MQTACFESVTSMKLYSTRLRLDGIRLEHDAENVERYLHYLDGVHEVSVDVLTGYLYVTYEPPLISLSDIEENLRYMGYEPHEELERTGLR
jgi:copper chaperone CopZ